jgi:hypothetical protein
LEFLKPQHVPFRLRVHARAILLLERSKVRGVKPRPPGQGLGSALES